MYVRGRPRPIVIVGENNQVKLWWWSAWQYWPVQCPVVVMRAQLTWWPPVLLSVCITISAGTHNEDYETASQETRWYSDTVMLSSDTKTNIILQSPGILHDICLSSHHQLNYSWLRTLDFGLWTSPFTRLDFFRGKNKHKHTSISAPLYIVLEETLELLI